jgi:hypothetical protein
VASAVGRRYLVIDSNTYIACANMQYAHHDLATIQRLERAISTSDVRLLLPEPIRLEYFARQAQALTDTRSELEALKAAFLKDPKWPKLLDAEKERALAGMDKLIQEKEQNAREVSSALTRLFASRSCTVIPITADQMVAGYTRFLGKKRPYTAVKGKPAKAALNADCMMVEGLASFLRDKGSCEVFLCTNDSDFFKDEKSDPPEIHPDIGAGMDAVIRGFRSPYGEYGLLTQVFGVKPDEEEAQRYREAEAAARVPLTGYSFDPRAMPSITYGVRSPWGGLTPRYRALGPAEYSGLLREVEDETGAVRVSEFDPRTRTWFAPLPKGLVASVIPEGEERRTSAEFEDEDPDSR